MKVIDAKGIKKINRQKGIIVSYPRNGLNWVRYCIEYFSGLQTPGKTKIYDQGKFAVYRTHNVKRPGPRSSCYCAFYDHDGKPIHKKVLLLLRDYHESYIRVAKRKQNGVVPTAEEIRNGKIFNFKDYFENLKAYDQYSGTKMIVRYHNLVKDFSEITKILDFFGFSYDLSNFDIEEHRQKSINLYDTQHKSYSKDNLYNFTFHQSQVDPEVNKAIDEFVDANYKNLADKYLRLG
ncbi:MAG: hypothetical protein AB4057_20605 [Crocosphaera sp.]